MGKSGGKIAEILKKNLVIGLEFFKEKKSGNPVCMLTLNTW